jgi:hypothetical protein
MPIEIVILSPKDYFHYLFFKWQENNPIHAAFILGIQDNKCAIALENMPEENFIYKIADDIYSSKPGS